MESAPPQGTSYTTSKRRPSVPVIIGIVILHIAIFYGLLRAFAPGVVTQIENTVLSAVTVTVTTPPEQMPTAPDEAGAAGNPGKEATPKPTTAPTPKVPVKRDKPQPKATSTGTDTRSGATQGGDGTGAAGSGDGTGAGGTGSGRGGGIAVKPSVRSGQIDQARDFPVPEGGRQTRFGKSVVVVFTVTTDGRATGCSVARSSADAEATARVCPLVMEKIRFNPARTTDGTPVEARYGYEVKFNQRD
ncbi:energy transducer TonB [Erythrobacter sp. SDW2]|uniref:energy transducer TonB n=1 Tax=Erythrobacter sp. SDW2 TaxID=2907154 RepID=UPI001F34BBE4|nr:energy transducer TonB [Erythrobacter sp. SDW2]UIP07656.1 energy transducer TonB [Erythrobacter sp. SDW2]